MEKIGFIGGGNMAFAIASGFIKSGILKSEQIGVAGPNIENLSKWKNIGNFVTTDNTEIINCSDIIFICVKPSILKSCCEGIRKTYQPNINHKNKIILSVLAGVTIKQLEDELGFIGQSKIIRTMPNTSVQICEGCIVYSPNKNIAEYEIEKVHKLLNSLGLAKQVPENLIDPITGVAGCGPAFVYTIIEGLADGALKQGVPKDVALKFAAQTLLGASKTLLITGKHPAVLRDEVCSPGGSTICGVHELEKGQLRCTLMNAVEKAVEKSKALGNIK